MSLEHFETDIVVIGAGVVGLATATALARAGRDVLVVDTESLYGSGVSSRNSEVIHASVYYPPGSMKARLCLEGREKLYRYCEERHVPHRMCGKLIVAVGETEMNKLVGIGKRADEIGSGLTLITGDAARRLEPDLSPHVTAALHSPRTGIIDSHTLMTALTGELEDHGGMIALETPVREGEHGPYGFTLDMGGAAPAQLTANVIINASGLNAIPMARTMEGEDFIGRPFYAKGSYFSYSGRNPFSHLIYPTPVNGGLGVHLTFDLGGAARFGPDVEWLETDRPDTIDYNVDPKRLDGFEAAIRHYWPGLKEGRLNPDYSGVRPKISGPGDPAADFDIRAVHDGRQTRIHLLGIESPGLTSSLAIGDHVAALLGHG